jgi:hypothetical protein
VHLFFLQVISAPTPPTSDNEQVYSSTLCRPAYCHFVCSPCDAWHSYPCFLWKLRLLCPLQLCQTDSSLSLTTMLASTTAPAPLASIAPVISRFYCTRAFAHRPSLLCDCANMTLCSQPSSPAPRLRIRHQFRCVIAFWRHCSFFPIFRFAAIQCSFFPDQSVLHIFFFFIYFWTIPWYDYHTLLPVLFYYGTPEIA